MSKLNLDDLYKQLSNDSKYLAGYPCNTSFNYEDLQKFLKFNLNNVGDPFDDNLYASNTHQFETEVINWLAKLFKSNGNTWGYVTHGGTEGNMHGMYLAREVWPDGIVYMSEDTHYSIQKIVHLLRMQHVVVKSQENGEIDYQDFDNMIHMHRDKPAIIVANIGTTMKGAFDNIQKIKAVLKKHAIRRKYIHCDAALYGMILPFVAGAPAFDFSAGIDSIAVSGHKFIGLPVPAGIVLANKSHVERVKTAIEYIGAHDTTISGSRNGLTSLMLWKSINENSKTGFKKLVDQCYENTRYTVQKLIEIDWRYFINNHSTTVVIQRPPDHIVRKWQMAVCEEWSHIIVMPHFNKDMIDEIIEDLKTERNRW